MSKKLDKLIEKFKLIEAEIIEILKDREILVDGVLNKNDVKKSIKSYIKKVNKAKKLFEEYEKIAKQISDISSDEGDSEVLSKTIFEFSEEIGNKFEDKQNNDISSVAKKKQNKKHANKSKQSVKEF